MLRLVGSAQQPLLGLAERLLSSRRPALLPVSLPKGFDPIPPTSDAECDAVVSRLQSKAAEWAALPPADRAKLLRACLATTLAVADEAAAAGVAAKGSYGQGVGEELVVWVPVVMGLRELAEALEAGGAPRHNGVRAQPDGQLVVDAWPSGLEALLWGGFRGEVWLTPGSQATQGALYRRKAAGEVGAGAVGLVLGAGNQLPVAALDVLHMLVVQDQGPFLRRAFQPLVDAGYLEIVYGGGPVGKHLCSHADIASVHLTGSAATYDAIVWQGQPKTGNPPFKKHVGEELGCVTPYIIVPGPWSAANIEYVADSVAAGLTNNTGHNCLKAEVLVTDRAWPLRDQFLAALRRRLSSLPSRVAYYPGSDAKHAAFLSRFPDAERLGTGSMAADGGQVASGSGRAEVQPTPWLLKAGLSPDEAATQDENWCGVLQEVCLDCGGDPSAFMAAALPFTNERCWGTLSCSVFAHPTTQARPARKHRAGFDALIAGLRYGAVAVNVSSLISFVVTKLTWGAFPGNTPQLLQDIGSGDCFVHNTLLLDHPQKSVLWAPWRFHPTPFWSPTHRNLEATGRAALQFSAAPSLGGMLALARQAVLG